MTDSDEIPELPELALTDTEADAVTALEDIAQCVVDLRALGREDIAEKMALMSDAFFTTSDLNLKVIAQNIDVLSRANEAIHLLAPPYPLEMLARPALISIIHTALTALHTPTPPEGG